MIHGATRRPRGSPAAGPDHGASSWLTFAVWPPSTVARFGRLDVAVNNAGTQGGSGPITEQNAKNYAATSDPNVLGVILSLKHEVRVMPEHDHGSIINLSSTYGHVEEIADGIVLLASPAASFITGHVLNVDGGLTIH